MAVQTVPRSEPGSALPEPTVQMPSADQPHPTPPTPGPPTAPDHPRRRAKRPRNSAALAPYGVIAHARVVLSLLLAGLCLVTTAGSLLLLMTWRQEQTDGLEGSHVDRMWDVWDRVAEIERYLAIATLLVAVVWIAVATLNVRRATGRRRNPLLSATLLAAGAVGTWWVAREIVTPGLDDDDWVGIGGGFALQAVLLGFPLLALERLADAAEARHRPARVAVVMTIAFLVALQTTGAVSTIDRTTTIDGWGRAAAFVLIAALIQIVAALALTEAGRALEEGTQHRYELRHRFGESVLMQVGAPTP